MNFLYKLYYFFYLRNNKLVKIIASTEWIKFTNVSITISFMQSYMDKKSAYEQRQGMPYYLITFHESGSISLLSKLISSSDIDYYVYGKFKTKVVKWYFSDKFFNDINHFKSSNRNKKLLKV